MATEVSGRLIRILDIRTGMGKMGEWKNQDFILETTGQYPRLICISLWGERIDALKNFVIGDQIKATVDIESREFNGKWYTSVKAWQLEKTGSTTIHEQGTTLPEAPPITLADIPPVEEEFDDLPF